MGSRGYKGEAKRKDTAASVPTEVEVGVREEQGSQETQDILHHVTDCLALGCLLPLVKGQEETLWNLYRLVDSFVG